MNTEPAAVKADSPEIIREKTWAKGLRDMLVDLLPVGAHSMQVEIRAADLSIQWSIYPHEWYMSHVGGHESIVRAPTVDEALEKFANRRDPLEIECEQLRKDLAEREAKLAVKRGQKVEVAIS